jgi:hypothetical protein
VLQVTHDLGEAEGAEVRVDLQEGRLVTGTDRSAQA